jgi:16S rRNA processing protein RimM
MSQAPRNHLFHLGTVVGTHGLRGDLKVRPLSEDSTALATAREVVLRCADGLLQNFRPLRASTHKGLWLLRLEGREDIGAAQQLVGCEVLMPYDDLPEPADDEFYWHQLQGLKVIDQRLGELGVLTDLLSTAAHDIYVVHGPFGEVLIPVVAEFVLDIDPEAGLIRVDLPDDLVRLNNDV